jgi:hypothetical protein
MTIALATGHTVFDGAWRLTTPSVVIQNVIHAREFDLDP